MVNTRKKIVSMSCWAWQRHDVSQWKTQSY